MVYPILPREVIFLIPFLDARTRAALHAPVSKDWSVSFDLVFGNRSQLLHLLNYTLY